MENARAQDGSSLLRPEIAQGKAWGALGMGVGTRNRASRAEKLPAFFNTLAALSGGRIVPVPGGVLLLSGEREVLGACGARVAIRPTTMKLASSQLSSRPGLSRTPENREVPLDETPRALAAIGESMLSVGFRRHSLRVKGPQKL